MSNTPSNKLSHSDSEAAKSLDEMVTRWIRPEVLDINAYYVPDPGDMVKLDAMENPYSWPESLNASWLEKLTTVAINRYPDPAANDVKSAIRSAFSVPDTMDILLGNGSDEIIQMLAMAVAKPDRVVLAPEPSFVMYKMIALMAGMEYVGVPLQSDFSLDADTIINAIQQYNPALVFLAYPNNPTGNLFDTDVIRAILRVSQGLVIIDEAYQPFAGTSLIDWLGQYNNLLIMRTVSKMGMAGLRLGYLLGDKRWIQQVDKMRLPYNINVLTQLTARLALQNAQAFMQQTQTICKDREILYQEMDKLANIKIYPTFTNFILFRVIKKSSQQVFDYLKQQGILVKNLGNSPGPLHNCLRVTIGTPDENARFLAALKSSLQE